MPIGNVLNFTQGFLPDAIGEIPLDHAVARVGAFCSDPDSGFFAYDLVGYVARKSGRLEEIGPWTILVADALAGRIRVGDVNKFARHMEEFAKRLGDVPKKDLACTDEGGLSRVIDFCCFGFRGAWAPKITKVGALFRNEAIPILDGHLARAFGYPRNGFTAGRESRWAAITKVVSALRVGISAQKEELATVRDRVAVNAPAVTILSDVRLTDLILWTSQDDRDSLSRGRMPWQARPTRTPPLTEDLARWITLGNPPRPA
ncbi:MAG: hypothetical protein QOH66_2230 [Actinomycetota bacterium]|jgi:hypothetical protein|nr:hypothetical protein [Actinomycetota bacterium]